MAKRITNTYDEPISLPLLMPKGLLGQTQRTHTNLLVGESIDRNPDGSYIEELSPEAAHMFKRGKLEVVDFEDVELVEVPLNPHHVADLERIYDEDLETQLLGADSAE